MNVQEINRNASVECTSRAPTSEFPTAIAKGSTEFRSQVILGASVHGYIFIDYSNEKRKWIACQCQVDV